MLFRSGIEYALDNPEEAIDIVLQYASQEDRDHMRFMMDTELAAAQSDLTDENGIGWMTAEQWRALHDYLVEFGGIAALLDDVSVTFDDGFLQRAYQDGELVWPSAARCTGARLTPDPRTLGSEDLDLRSGIPSIGSHPL